MKDSGTKRKLIVITFLTLDGVMQAPGGKNEDTSGDFQHGGWQMSYGEGDTTMSDHLGKAGALLLGRKTYDIFASYWPTVGKDVPWFGSFMNNITKYVASKTLQKTDWQNSNLLKGDVAESVAKLKAESGKDIYVLGSGDLCQSLMRHNLVDEYVLMIHPLALGKGKRLFQENGLKQEFKVLNSKVTTDGVLVITYKVKSSSVISN